MLVLRGCGPKGYPGMPEVANMPLPRKLLERGVRDMVRICDGRMSGTAYGTVVLHVTPEAADGGPLALVRTGDIVVLDVAARRLDVEVDAEELASRTPDEATLAGCAKPERGWQRLYVEHVTQASTGADLDFLVGASGTRCTVSRTSLRRSRVRASLTLFDVRGASAAPRHESIMTSSPDITFHDGRSIPQLGYGVWQVENDVAADVVTQAVEAGFRHIDTARGYNNEEVWAAP